jgi:hypothetical protein
MTVPDSYIKITIDAGDRVETERVTDLVYSALHARHGWLVDQVGYTKGGAKSLWYLADTVRAKIKDNTND